MQNVSMDTKEAKSEKLMVIVHPAVLSIILQKNT